MTEPLERLLEKRQQNPVVLHEEHLAAGMGTPAELLLIFSSLLAARFGERDYPGAIVAGELAVSLARELGDWERFGAAAVTLAAAYQRSGRLDMATSLWFEYLSKLPLYGRVRRYEFIVWRNLALAYMAQGDGPQALEAIRRATELADRSGSARAVLLARQTLIGIHIRMGVLGPVPRLLARCQHHLLGLVGVPGARQCRLRQSRLRVMYAIATGRLQRAMAIAVRALSLAEGLPAYQSAFHLHLAHITYRMGCPNAAHRHAAVARIFALKCRRQDLENEAMDFLFAMATGQPAPPPGVSAAY